MSIFQKSETAVRCSSPVRLISLSALLAAMSMALKLLSFTAGPFRIGFENLPILLCGILFGPAAGLFCGICSDLAGCVLCGYTVNPIITLGSAAIGFASGFASKRLFFRGFSSKILAKTAACVFSADLIGALIIKTFGLYIYYRYPMPVLLLRIPQTLILSCAEAYVLYLLLKNKAFTALTKGM